MSRELLRQALNALVHHAQQTRPIHNTDLCIAAIRSALAQPEAEPVLWVPPEREGEFHHDHSSVTGYRNRMAGWVPLYATPQAQPTHTGNKQRLLDLLARIHRDGGHYVAAHGIDKACADADRLVAEMFAQPDPIDGFGGNLDAAFDAAPAVQPLSDLQLESIIAVTGHGSALFDFARAIEQAHGIAAPGSKP